MRPEAYLQRIEAEKARLAKEAMEKPGGGDAFAYGRAVGMYAGLDLAANLLIGMFAEKERDDFK